MRSFREGLERKPRQKLAYRIGVGLLGAIVLVLGILAIPYPGPGWAIVFVGLAILATEFTWAKRVLRYARARYDAWSAWLGRQSVLVRVLVLGATGLVVLTTLWLLNALFLVATVVGLDSWTWLQSPFF